MKITFDLAARDPDQLEYVNKALENLPLSNLKIEDSKGYLQTKIDYDENERPKATTYRYGFDSLVLDCGFGDEGPYYYQIDAEAFPKGQVANSAIFHDLWCSAHPDRVMRVLTQYDFKTADAFVVLHHQAVK